MSDKKPIDLKEYGKAKVEKIKTSYYKKLLESKGLEYNEENIKLLEYDLSFPDDIKSRINEENLLSLIKDGNELVACNYEAKKIRLIFASGDTLEIFVDINGNLQTDLTVI